MKDDIDVDEIVEENTKLLALNLALTYTNDQLQKKTHILDGWLCRLLQYGDSHRAVVLSHGDSLIYISCNIATPSTFLFRHEPPGHLVLASYASREETEHLVLDFRLSVVKRPLGNGWSRFRPSAGDISPLIDSFENMIKANPRLFLHGSSVALEEAREYAKTLQSEK